MFLGRDRVILLWAWWVSLTLSRFHTFVIPHVDSHTISALYANDTITSLEMCLLVFMSVFSLRQLVVEMTSTAPSPSSISRCHLIRELFEHSLVSPSNPHFLVSCGALHYWWALLQMLKLTLTAWVFLRSSDLLSSFPVFSVYPRPSSSFLHTTHVLSSAEYFVQS